MYLNNGVVGYERGDFVILNKPHIYYTMSGFEYAKPVIGRERMVLAQNITGAVATMFSSTLVEG